MNFNLEDIVIKKFEKEVIPVNYGRISISKIISNSLLNIKECISPETNLNEQTNNIIKFLSLPTGSLTYLIDKKNKLKDIGSWNGEDID